MNKWLSVFLVAIVLFPGVSLSDEKKFVLTTGVKSPLTTPNQQGFLDQVIGELFSRIGKKGEVAVYEASARSIKAANDGLDDGLALRIAGLEKKFPNLIRVPEKIMDNDFVAYSLGKGTVTSDWHSLDDGSVAYILGWQIFNNNLTHHKNLVKVKGATQLFDVFKAGRADYVLYERWQGLWRTRELGLDAKVHEPPLASMEMFMYLHKRHENLVEPLAKELAKMKRDGSYQKIVDRVLSPLVN